MPRKAEPRVVCPICASQAPMEEMNTLAGTPVWDARRLDDQGQPLIWPYLDEEETDLEKFARCPACQLADKRMDLNGIGPGIINLITRIASARDISKELAFFNLLKYGTEYTNDGDDAREG